MDQLTRNRIVRREVTFWAVGLTIALAYLFLS